MTDILQAITQALRESKEITDIVGEDIYPMFIPQYAKVPAVVYYPVSSAYDSALTKDTGFVVSIVQFDCHDKSFKKARILSRAVKRLFQDYSGDLFGVDIQATFIKSDFIVNGSSSNKFDNEDTVHVIEFEFHYNEK